jgi:hypothetical protein
MNLTIRFTNKALAVASVTAKTWQKSAAYFIRQNHAAAYTKYQVLYASGCPG